MLPPQQPAVQIVSVQHMHAPCGVHRLRFLVDQARARRDRERHDARRRRQDAFPARQVRDHGVDATAAATTMPARAAVRRPRVADVPVVGRRVRPRLLLVLRVVRIVPARVVHELAVHPRRVETAAVGRGLEAVDVRVVPHALEVRAEESVCPHPRFCIRVWRCRGGASRVHAEMVIA